MNKRMNQYGHIKSTVANGSHGNTLTEVDSPFIFIDKETLSFRSEGIFYIIKLIYFRHDHYEQNFKSLRAGRHENSIVGMDPMATHCRKLIVTKQIRTNNSSCHTDWHSCRRHYICYQY